MTKDQLFEVINTTFRYLGKINQKKFSRLFHSDFEKRFVELVFIVNRSELFNLPIKPHFEEELIPNYLDILTKFIATENVLIQELAMNYAKIIENMTEPNLLIMFGQRLTESSIQEVSLLPPTSPILLENANQLYNDKLTVSARSLAKHSSQCPINYWGQIRGSPQIQNEFAMKTLRNLLENFTWWNLYGHFKHEILFEIRDKTGHGARWSQHGKFIGFIEAVDLKSGTSFISK